MYAWVCSGNLPHLYYITLGWAIIGPSLCAFGCIVICSRQWVALKCLKTTWGDLIEEMNLYVSAITACNAHFAFSFVERHADTALMSSDYSHSSTYSLKSYEGRLNNTSPPLPKASDFMRCPSIPFEVIATLMCLYLLYFPTLDTWMVNTHSSPLPCGSALVCCGHYVMPNEKRRWYSNLGSCNTWYTPLSWRRELLAENGELCNCSYAHHYASHAHTVTATAIRTCQGGAARPGSDKATHCMHRMWPYSSPPSILS